MDGCCANLCFSKHPISCLGISQLVLHCIDCRLLCAVLANDCFAAGRRPHQSLAAVGVAALVRLIVSAGAKMSAAVWVDGVSTLAQARHPCRTTKFACAHATEAWAQVAADACPANAETLFFTRATSYPLHKDCTADQTPCTTQCAAETRPAIPELADLVRDHGSGGGEGAPGEREGEGDEADGGGPWAIQSPGASPRGAPRRSASLDPDRRHVRSALESP